MFCLHTHSRRALVPLGVSMLCEMSPDLQILNTYGSTVSHTNGALVVINK